MKFLKSSLAFLTVLSTVASPFFLDVVDGAPSKSKIDESKLSSWSTSSKSSKSFRSSKSSKNNKSSKSSKNNKSSKSDITKESFELVKGKTYAEFSQRVLKSDFTFDQDLDPESLSIGRIERIILEEYLELTKHIEREAGPSRTTSEAVMATGTTTSASYNDNDSGEVFLLEKCNLDAEINKDAIIQVRDIACLVTFCDTSNDCAFLARAERKLVGKKDEIYVITGGWGKYFDIAGFLKFSSIGKKIEVEMEYYNSTRVTSTEKLFPNFQF